MKTKSLYLFLAIITITYSSFSQTNEILCLKKFNAVIYKSLADLRNNEIDISSENISLIFELNVSKCGIIDFVKIKKSNLNNFGISDSSVAFSIIRKKFPCLRDIYYQGSQKPDNIVVVYNTKILNENDLSKIKLK